jgi:multiple antibiotic resistance protein
VDTFLLMLAALFPVINPPGSALVFLSLTKRASASARRALAARVAVNAFFVMVGSLLVGAVVLKFYGISVPVLRVAGGMIVAASGWKLLNEGSDKTKEDLAADGKEADYANQAFYPFTLPLTTGPGTIAIMISLGLSRSRYNEFNENVSFFVGGLLATVVMSAAIYVCFAYSDRVQKLLGRGGTDIAVRLSAFILFCIGVQIVWVGVSDLLADLNSARPATR